MAIVIRSLVVLALVLAFGDSAFAQEAAAKPSSYAGLGMGLSLVGAGLGIGLIGFAALSGIARQPEAADKIQGPMVLLAALVEGAAIISLVLCLVISLL
ncbi:ATP synthase F0 subunit C [Tuwongella immobilis]|uniref:ATP synthase subunit c n=1 Tax=Tuwongella immobilis TaxID=692036 RepID=A0A6C2YR50_9BACT|nr:ATP synthase F0 subunit C [Tuwongella immobilis]VIP03465.1 atp synthase f0 subunit c : ATP synthase C chain OS=Planctomyces maris DSM 8797 GN=PM8797T_28859 PE=3 SV=1: ATP-synt_C [Tuwongella immobilis]VTS04302.1 atp synthase f0 subunit c : ATP synthase C chain OS=Planctomyces maris DSM 8797 GN=PM8797T_28859 PE=3 SV=1: ATP-synt_C [Tuwongella immobilis]